MSVLDTLSMLEKRASGEEPEPKYSEQELRLFALEMQKRAGWLGEGLAKGLYGVGAVAGAPYDLAYGAADKAFDLAADLPGSKKLPGFVGKGLKGIGNLAAEGVSTLAAFPFDHPGATLSAALPLGFLALDTKSRADEIKQKGKVPDLAGPRLR